ncbi:MAG: DUF1934 domain-containing protein [Oscillospiraceae bacterium]|nr:DUF1934 domain-containing protein [Oscillospiraceae bacterium]
MKDVVISINSIHRYEEGEDEDRIEFTTDGLYHYENGTGYLSYLESEVTGLPGTETVVEIRPDEVVVDRRGSITSRMVFRRGEKNSFQYETPFGMATMGMATKKISHDFNARGGSMTIDYVLDVAHAVVERNRFCIDVRPM